MKWFLVFVGSGLGGCLRLFTADLARKLYPASFPIGTLAANIIACFLLGAIIVMANHKLIDEKTRLFLVVGLCGGYSTFSTFSYETIYLLTNQKILEGSLYIAASIITCLLAILAGSYLGRQVF